MESQYTFQLAIRQQELQRQMVTPCQNSVRERLRQPQRVPLRLLPCLLQAAVARGVRALFPPARALGQEQTCSVVAVGDLGGCPQSRRTLVETRLREYGPACVSVFLSSLLLRPKSPNF